MENSLIKIEPEEFMSDFDSETKPVISDFTDDSYIGSSTSNQMPGNETFALKSEPELNIHDVHVKLDFDDAAIKSESPDGFRDKERHDSHIISKRTYKCGKCLVLFPTKNVFVKHKLEHHRPTCNECGYYFRSSQSLSSHVNKWHRFKCRICETFFDTASLLATHKLGHRRPTCTDCGVSFINENKLVLHKISKHKATCDEFEAKLKCQACAASFHSKQMLAAHNLEHGGPQLNFHKFSNRKHKCQVCLCSFRSKSMLIAHNLAHHKPTCEDCGVSFVNEQKLDSHRISAHKHKCQACLSSFRSISMLAAHNLEQHGHTCKDCGVSFMTEQKLDSHKIYNHAFKCQTCMISFGTEIKLAEHISDVHTTHACEDCKACFKNKGDFDSHVNSEHRHICSICKACFYSRRLLAKHMWAKRH